jgi:hypothetical protein
LDDEHSWLPPLLEVASNPKILLGRPGYIDCSIDVQVLEAPAIMDRSEGDLHRIPKTIFAIIRSTRRKKLPPEIYGGFVLVNLSANDSQ